MEVCEGGDEVFGGGGGWDVVVGMEDKPIGDDCLVGVGTEDCRTPVVV